MLLIYLTSVVTCALMLIIANWAMPQEGLLDDQLIAFLLTFTPGVNTVLALYWLWCFLTPRI